VLIHSRHKLVDLNESDRLAVLNEALMICICIESVLYLYSVLNSLPGLEIRECGSRDPSR
jgi:hypothetical protein